jgi:dihydroxyacetone kinase-like protein
MSRGLTTAVLSEAIERIVAKLEASADELNALDAALGDGDLGVTMVRGGRSVMAELPNLPDDVGLALLKCAQALTRLSGSTYGTLLATGLLSAAKSTKGRRDVPWTEISTLLGNAISAMSQRSGGRLGDKTVLDAVESVRAASNGLHDPAVLATAADQAVAATLERFRDQPSRQGRARIFGDKSVGRDDPGMVAFKRITEALK